MTLGETIIVLSEVIVAACRGLNDLTSCIMLRKHVPEVIRGGNEITISVVVHEIFERTTDESPDSHPADSTYSVLVVAVELREGFLDDSAPNGFICTSSSENVPVDVGVVFIRGDVVINDDGDRDTQGKHVDAIDTFGFNGV